MKGKDPLIKGRGPLAGVVVQLPLLLNEHQEPQPHVDGRWLVGDRHLDRAARRWRVRRR